jgi:hypothetical protein
VPKERFDRRWQWPLLGLGRGNADQSELMTRALLHCRRELGGVLKTGGRHKTAMEALKLLTAEDRAFLDGCCHA